MVLINFSFIHVGDHHGKGTVIANETTMICVAEI